MIQMIKQIIIQIVKHDNNDNGHDTNDNNNDNNDTHYDNNHNTDNEHDTMIMKMINMIHMITA